MVRILYVMDLAGYGCCMGSLHMNCAYGLVWGCCIWTMHGDFAYGLCMTWILHMDLTLHESCIIWIWHYMDPACYGLD